MRVKNLQNAHQVTFLLLLVALSELSKKILYKKTDVWPGLHFWIQWCNFASENQQDMRKKEQLNSIIEICPVRNVIARFGNKWALLVILVLSESDKIRFNELGRKILDISSRILSNTLRTLEADGLVDRTYYQEVPPRVEYSLTETGRSLVPIIIQLTEWAQSNMRTIIDHRNKHEE